MVGDNVREGKEKKKPNCQSIAKRKVSNVESIMGDET